MKVWWIVMRKKIIYLIELMILVFRHRKHYMHYLSNRKKELYARLRQAGCTHIKAVQPLEWKVSYGSYYFSALMNHKKVFVKVTGPATKDGYVNELACDTYIKQHSPFLADRTPKVLKSFVSGEYYVILFEYFNILEEIKKDDLQQAACEFLEEYTRIGIIHQDLKPSNLTFHNGRYCIIDYGYSICQGSNHTRLSCMNYIEFITEAAKAVLEDADYYYDDAIAVGMEHTDRSAVNFIVGRKEIYFIRLAGKLYEYRLEQLPGRSVRLLHKYLRADLGG